MSEARTPIEDKVENITEAFTGGDYYFEYVDPKKVIELLKAYREKYKHTKEDVIKAFIQGAESESDLYYSNDKEGHLYYNETHKNQD